MSSNLTAAENLAQAIRQLPFRPAYVIILTLSYQQNITSNQKDETNQKGTDLLGQEGQAPIPRAAFCVKQESGFVFGGVSV
jgi:hypothetical protein